MTCRWSRLSVMSAQPRQALGRELTGPGGPKAHPALPELDLTTRPRL
jgi:hypothetical protein